MVDFSFRNWPIVSLNIFPEQRSSQSTKRRYAIKDMFGKEGLAKPGPRNGPKTGKLNELCYTTI